MTGVAGDPPQWSSAAVNYPDQLVALLGAGLMVHDLVTGERGIHRDVSQREVVAWTLADILAQRSWTGKAPGRSGNRRPGATPHDVYPTAGRGWVAIACVDTRQRRALSGLVEGLVDIDDEGYWREHQDGIDEAITRWTRRRTRWAAVAQLRAGGVPAVPVRDAADRAHDSEHRSRGVALPWSGHRLKGFPMVLHGQELPVPRRAPELGRNVTDWNGDEVARFLDRCLRSDRPGSTHE